MKLDNEYEKYYRLKVHRFETRGERVVRVLGDDANPGTVKGGAEAGKVPFSSFFFFFFLCRSFFPYLYNFENA